MITSYTIDCHSGEMEPIHLIQQIILKWGCRDLASGLRDSLQAFSSVCMSNHRNHACSRTEAFSGSEDHTSSKYRRLNWWTA
jgi:hypothetical protein